MAGEKKTMLPIRVRAAEAQDIGACVRIRPLAIEDYQSRLGITYQAPDAGGLHRLFGHLLATDPERFAVAYADAAGGEVIVGFASATLRNGVWFLGAMFIDPAFHGRGVGTRLLRRVLPARGAATVSPILATCTDALQPISNALYAREGIAPRMPIFRLSGRLTDTGTSEVGEDRPRSSPLEKLGTSGWETQRGELGQLDREVLGFEHPADHDFVRAESVGGWLFHSADGALLGYGYVHSDGTLGPVAASRADALAPIIREVICLRGTGDAAILWLAGAAGEPFQALLRQGLRLQGYPAFACWTEPFADFARYVPWSLTLL